MHSLRLLLDLLSILLVERRQVPRTCYHPAGVQMAHRLSRRLHCNCSWLPIVCKCVNLGRATWKDERRVFRVQVSHDYELHKILPKTSQPRLGNCRGKFTNSRALSRRFFSGQKDVDQPSDTIQARTCRGINTMTIKKSMWSIYSSSFFSAV